MKRLFALVCLLVMFSTSCAYADEDPVLVEVVNMLQEVLDLSDRGLALYGNMGQGWKLNRLEIVINGLKGNEGVDIAYGYAKRVFFTHPVNSLERMHCLLYYLNHFDDIRNMLPPGIELVISTRENDGSSLYITEDNYQDYLNLYREALGTGK